jgi:hypothetical protein
MRPFLIGALIVLMLVVAMPAVCDAGPFVCRDGSCSGGGWFNAQPIRRVGGWGKRAGQVLRKTLPPYRR